MNSSLTKPLAFLAAVIVLSNFGSPVAGRTQQSPPNIVLIFADDLGYADVGLYGARNLSLPNFDRLAKEGKRFTRFYTAQAVCTAARAALLTGNYPNRIGLTGALGPSSKHGINEGELTVAELVKRRGYATAVYGKWHLGHHPQFLPTRHGFDEFFGLPYSNDMWPRHPEAPPGTYPPLPLIEGERVIELMPDQSQLTTRYTERAVGFIERNKSRPFFLYLAHSMPHVPLHVSDKFKGRSQRGLFGDVLMELDWSVGEILRALRENGLDRRTLVVFTSDNGPWLSYGDHAGSADPLREGKGTAWEGGTRVPCVMRWPGRIPAGGVSHEPLMTIDLLPTLGKLVGDEIPPEGADGRDVWPLIAGAKAARNPHDAYYFYYDHQLQAVMSGRWKLYLPHSYRTLAGGPGGQGGVPTIYQKRQVKTELYDLEKDPGETKDIAAERSDIVGRLEAVAERARHDLGDSLTNRTGRGLRPPGRLADGK